MRTSIRVLLVVLIFAVCSASCFCQAITDTGTSPLIRMLQLSGWANVPNDATAVGQIRDSSSGPADAASLTVTAKGWEQIRYDVKSAESLTTTILNGRQAARTADGKTKELPIAFAVSSRVPFFPFYTILTKHGAIQSISHLGTEAVDSDAADVYELVPQVDPSDKSAQFRLKAQRMKFWISQSTGLLLQISYVQLAVTNSNLELRYFRKYSDYRMSGAGFLFPFHQEQWLDGQPQITVDFTNVTFNTGVKDSTFAVPSADEGEQR